MYVHEVGRPWSLMHYPIVSSTPYQYINPFHAQEEHPTAQVEAIASGVSGLAGCIFVGHTNTDTDRSVGRWVGGWLQR